MLHIVVATRNRHKFGELKALFAIPGIRWRSLAEWPDVPSVRETGRTFDANAMKKARAVARATGCLALADDSGLEVEALGGAPGVRSARFAGGHGDDRVNNEKLLRELNGLPAGGRRARYRCSLALARPGSSYRRAGAASARVIALTRGAWSGRIAAEPKGRRGFGYDPIFFIPKWGKTVAQLPTAMKQRSSHRARAARAMQPLLRRLVLRSGPRLSSDARRGRR